MANEPTCAGSPSSATNLELGAPGQRARSTTGDLHRPPANLDLLEPFVDALKPAYRREFDVPGPVNRPTAAALQLPRSRGSSAGSWTGSEHDEFGIFGISGGGGLAQHVAFQDP